MNFMKIKLFLLLIIIPFIIKGQEWAPIGAEWYYDITYAFSGNIDFHKVYCDSTINIKGVNCKRINIDYCACNNHFCDKLYTFQSSDTIFFYNPDIDTFQILYNFGAKTGESWPITYKDIDNSIDTVIVHVDSIGTSLINSMSLRKLYVSNIYNTEREFEYPEKSIIIEKIGDINLLINIHDLYYGLCDNDILSGLRCYQDPEFGLYSTGLRESCNFTYKWTATQVNIFSNTNLYPNPVTDFLIVPFAEHRKVEYQLFDSKGRMIKAGNETVIDMSYFESGLYYVRIVTEDKFSLTQKIIKH
jgi:hypothetical protein